MTLNQSLKISMVAVGFALVTTVAHATEPVASSAKPIGRLIGGAKVRINGEPAKVGQVIFEGSKIDAETGGAVIEIDGNRVVQVSEGGIATLSSSADGSGKCCNIFLEKGRVEGVNRIGVNKEISGISVTTPTGKVEAEGGRYIVQVDANGTRVDSVDGGVTVQSLSSKVTLDAGQTTAVVSERTVAGSGQTTSTISPPIVLTRVNPTSIGREGVLDVMRAQTDLVVQAPQTTPTMFQSININPIVPVASPINRDPLQPVGQANVSVKFNY